MHETPQISPEYKAVTREVLAELPKVVLNHRLGVDAGDIAKQLHSLADAAVVYAELTLPLAGGAGQEDIDAVLRALADAPLDARLLLGVSQSAGVAEVARIAQLAVDNHGEKVLGFRLSGIDEDNPVSAHAEALGLLRDNFVPVVVEFSDTADIPAIREALRHGVARLGNGIRIFEDFEVDLGGIKPGRMSAWVRDRGIALELSPSTFVDAETELTDHPLPLLQELGFRCAVHQGTGSLLDELMGLVETFDYGLEELFELTRDALAHSFAPVLDREEILVQHILPPYERMGDSDGDSTDTPETDI